MKIVIDKELRVDEQGKQYHYTEWDKKLSDGTPFHQIVYLPEPVIITKEQKKSELDRACHEYIIQGFTHNDKVYDFELENQVNMEAIKNNFALGFITEYDYYAKGEQCTAYTKDDFMALYSAGQEHKFGAIVKYKQLCAQVDATEDYESITW